MTAIAPTTLAEAVRVALHHLRAEQRLRPRYNATACGAHVDAAARVLTQALREEEVTREVPIGESPAR